jgi:hypothetical protein
MDAVHHPLVPVHKKGIANDFTYAIHANNVDEAAAWFLDMKDNLLNVNSWKGSDTIHIQFALADKHKKNLHRNAHTHDLLQVHPEQYQVGDIWSYALVDVIEYDYDPDADHESIGMRICPACLSKDSIVHHPELASITFVCGRRNTQLYASCHIRNLEQGDDGTDTWAKVTNEQWHALLKSFAEG